MAQELRPPGYGEPNFKPARSQRNKARKPLNPRSGMSKAHLECIRQLPCCACLTRSSSEAHHLKQGIGERGTGMKSTDKWTVPLCRYHHTGREGVERVSSNGEWRWFRERGIQSPLDLAIALWNASGDLPKMTRLVLEAKGAGK